MNKKVFAIVLVIVLLAVVGYFYFTITKNKDNVINEDNVANNNVISNEEVEKNVVLSDLPFNYTIEDAIDDGCVTIEPDGTLNNIDELDLFFDNAKNGISGDIRIVEEYGEDSIAITDASFDGEILSILYDYSRSSESGDGIIINKFSMSEYYLVKEPRKLEGGNSVMLYKIINKEDSSDVYYLTGYVVYDV